MAKSSSTFTCTACGASHSKWIGKCEACGAWNTIVEEVPLSAGPKALGGKGKSIPLTDLATQEAAPPRAASGINELDRVLGGGLVPASAILVGGDPGIGKSTLLLQATAAFARRGLSTMYISGEEAAAQVQMRAQRLGLSDAKVALGCRNQPARHPDHPRHPPPRPCGDRLDPDHVARYGRFAPPVRSLRSAPPAMNSSPSPKSAAYRSSSSAMSPKRARSPGPASSNTWSTPSSISKANAATSSASCAPSRTALAPRMRLACSR